MKISKLFLSRRKIHSESGPDLSIVLGSLDDFRDSHPATAEWVIEVAVSTLSLDLSKRKIYAEANIPHYWIIEPENGRILLFSNPISEGYISESVLGKTEEIHLPIEPFSSIPMDWI